MKIKQLFTNFNLLVGFENLDNIWGQYRHVEDIIILDSDLKKSMPGVAKIVFLHEMIHSTGHASRLNRRERLVKEFGPYEKNSKSYRVEECIADIGALVCALKLGMLNDYNKVVMIDGIKDNYGKDIYIPWRELVAACRYYCDPICDFNDELDTIKSLLGRELGLCIKDSYSKAS